MTDPFIRIPLGADRATKEALAAQAEREGKMLVGTVEPSVMRQALDDTLASMPRIASGNRTFLDNLNGIASGKVLVTEGIR
jgi:hypothetical protein